MENWIADNCPMCGEKNYVCQGDIEDVTGIDIDGIKCYKCSFEWLLEPVDSHLELDEAWFEDGKSQIGY